MSGPGRRPSAARGTVLGAVLLAAVALTACSGAPSAVVRQGATGPQRYVALGDSWVAAPLVPEQVGTPLDCARSTQAYPALVAAALDAGEFVDASCGGASTKHFFEPQRATLGGRTPPQLDALDERTELVTIGIGGNDVKFPRAALRCGNLLAIPLGPPPWGRPCTEELASGGRDELTERIAEARPKVAAAYAAVRERAPRAQVWVVGYPTALPHTGPGCWPDVPLLPPDVAWLRARYEDMNAMLAEEAARAGFGFVDTYGPSAEHHVCRPLGEAWVNGLALWPSGIPLHPNHLSHRATAQVVVAALRSGVGGAPGAQAGPAT